MNKSKWMPLPTPRARQRCSVCQPEITCPGSSPSPPHQEHSSLARYGQNCQLVCTLQFKTLPPASSRRQSAGSNYQVKLSYLLRQSALFESAQSLLGLYLVSWLGGPDIPRSWRAAKAANLILHDWYFILSQIQLVSQAPFLKRISYLQRRGWLALELKSSR